MRGAVNCIAAWQVPANRMYPFPEVFNLLDERIALTGRRVWIAYLLLQGKRLDPHWVGPKDYFMGYKQLLSLRMESASK